MLPKKIKELVKSLRTKTEAGLYEWEYDDKETCVTLDTKKNRMKISYKFNFVEEVGQFNLTYFNKAENKDYYFSTTEMYEDYKLVQILFDVAQSSEIDIDDEF